MRMLSAVILTSVFAAGADKPFVPPDFAVPEAYAGKGYKLVPLGPDLVRHDYDAYMSSIDHIRANFGSGRWPRPGITMKEALADVEGEIARFRARQSFAYAVLTPDGSRELGCFYLRPAKASGFDASANLWVTKEQFDRGFEATLVRDMKQWLGKWPFQKVDWPARFQ
ncbi:MAG: hypothetical protein R2762_30510 [Bryobacteraceae bacterium]